MHVLITDSRIVVGLFAFWRGVITWDELYEILYRAPRTAYTFERQQNRSILITNRFTIVHQ